MNAFYMQQAPVVDALAPQIAKLLEAAANLGVPGEPRMAVQFRRPAPSMPAS